MDNDITNLTQSYLTNKEEIHRNFVPRDIVITNSMISELFDKAKLIDPNAAPYCNLIPFVSQITGFFSGVKHSIRMAGALNRNTLTLQNLDFAVSVFDIDSPYNGTKVNVAQSVFNAETLEKGVRKLANIYKSNVE